MTTLSGWCLTATCDDCQWSTCTCECHETTDDYATRWDADAQAIKAGDAT